MVPFLFLLPNWTRPNFREWSSSSTPRGFPSVATSITRARTRLRRPGAHDRSGGVRPQLPLDAAYREADPGLWYRARPRPLPDAVRARREARGQGALGRCRRPAVDALRNGRHARTLAGSEALLRHRPELGRQCPGGPRPVGQLSDPRRADRRARPDAAGQDQVHSEQAHSVGPLIRRRDRRKRSAGSPQPTAETSPRGLPPRPHAVLA